MPSIPAEGQVISGDRLCKYAEQFQCIAQESIFARITGSTTPQQFEAAQESLLRLREELINTIKRRDTFHFPYLSGGHICVEDCYLEAAMCLKNLAILAPKAPVDGPKPRVLSPDEVVNNLAEILPQRTFLGEGR